MRCHYCKNCQVFAQSNLEPIITTTQESEGVWVRRSSAAADAAQWQGQTGPRGTQRSLRRTCWLATPSFPPQSYVLPSHFISEVPFPVLRRQKADGLCIFREQQNFKIINLIHHLNTYKFTVSCVLATLGFSPGHTTTEWKSYFIPEQREASTSTAPNCMALNASQFFWFDFLKACVVSSTDKCNSNSLLMAAIPNTHICEQC